MIWRCIYYICRKRNNTSLMSCVYVGKLQGSHEKMITNHNHDMKKDRSESPIIAHERLCVHNGFEDKIVSSITHVSYESNDRRLFQNNVGNDNETIHCNISDLAKR